MKQFIRGFTLIEMIIVVVIVSIMLLITLNISSNQTRSLRYRITREIFVSNYNNFIIKAITSSENLILTFHTRTGEIISSPDLYFEPTPNAQILSINNSTQFEGATIGFSGTINQCLYNNNPTSNVSLILKDTTTSLTGSLCINLSTCKIKEGEC